MFQLPLPNDLIRNPPWPETVMTQPIDDAFLTVISASEANLRKAGYYLKYGIEINLGLLSANEARDLQNRKHSPILIAWRQSCQDQFTRDLAQVNSAMSLPTVATKIYRKLQHIAKQYERKPCLESVEWLANWQMTQHFYNQITAVQETKQCVLAKKNS